MSNYLFFYLLVGVMFFAISAEVLRHENRSSRPYLNGILNGLFWPITIPILIYLIMRPLNKE